jgi:hypothetical protein
VKKYIGHQKVEGSSDLLLSSAQDGVYTFKPNFDDKGKSKDYAIDQKSKELNVSFQ